MIDLLRIPGATKRHHHIRLNREFRADLQWWVQFLRSWNGVGMMSAVARCGFGATITSDASGSWGCGAYVSSGEWFQLEWLSSWQPIHITVKELLPVVLSVAIWGSMWQGKAVRCRCDNAAVVAVVRSRYSKEPGLMHMLRCIFFMEAHFACMLSATHVPGAINTRADELSRNRLSSFLSKVPSASRCPSHIPQQLVQLITETEQDWTSPRWTQQFITCVRRA